MFVLSFGDSDLFRISDSCPPSFWRIALRIWLRPQAAPRHSPNSFSRLHSHCTCSDSRFYPLESAAPTQITPIITELAHPSTGGLALLPRALAHANRIGAGGVLGFRRRPSRRSAGLSISMSEFGYGDLMNLRGSTFKPMLGK
jgi:hypothetical protein